jgi:hypothetical protein
MKILITIITFRFMIKKNFKITNLLTLYILIINHKNNLMNMKSNNIMTKMASMMKEEYLMMKN